MKLSRVTFLLFSGIFLTTNAIAHTSVPEKMYAKEYYENGTLKAEGWALGNKKIKFWIFYHNNGAVASKGNYKNNKKDGYWYYYNTQNKLIKEGHYINGSAENWWIFYDIANQKKAKYQFKDNQKNGFALQYNKQKLMRAEKYENDEKVGEWTSVWAFKRDNPDVSLK
ncbi:toxin-antitoxin system YwqK family antitoxin [Patiriisocius hiemis]|uniref:Toxin-antitoxin system YwqK family antitoxin n=1 Tax=Patiriisocius hiemis TaxID=3075604 RepID=A0ABU2YGE2_9FLAO|nr:hypothetical protein [Constantimarinum sp. W242]MDT0556300.1 hypothetical protein [Constantimarinum sp. W242]